METFPIRPLFDRVIVREIPIENYYEKSDIVQDDLLGNSFVKERSDRGVIVAAGRNVEEVQVGDVVQYDEYCLSDPIFLNPAHKNRTDLPRYWAIREPDLKGVLGSRTERPTKTAEEAYAAYGKAAIELHGEFMGIR